MIDRTLFSSDHETFRDSFRKFIDKEIVPNCWRVCSESRLAGMPVIFIRIKANNSEKGMVRVTTSAERKLPSKKIRTMMTMETPSNKVLATVFNE